MHLCLVSGVILCLVVCLCDCVRSCVCCVFVCCWWLFIASGCVHGCVWLSSLLCLWLIGVVSLVYYLRLCAVECCVSGL